MLLLRFASLCGLAAGLAASLVAACLDLWFTSVWLTVLCLACAGVIGLRTGRFRLCSVGALAVVAGLGGWAWHVPFLEFHAFMDKASTDIEAHGAAALSTRNRVGVYALNLAMGGFGHLAGLHEVAQLSWLLAWPGPRVRYRDGAFLLRDPAVRSAVKEAHTRGTSQVAWPRYFHPSVSPSVALAANCPLVLHRGMRGDVVARCRVEYPRNSKLDMGDIAGQRAYLQEGVYWVLQESGWLHPFDVAWSISAQDIDQAPQHVAPVLLYRERLLLGVLAR